MTAREGLLTKHGLVRIRRLIGHRICRKALRRKRALDARSIGIGHAVVIIRILGGGHHALKVITEVVCVIIKVALIAHVLVEGMLGQIGPLGIVHESIEVVHFFLELLELLHVLRLDVFAHVVGPFELFAAERTQPYVFLDLFAVERDEGLHFFFGVFEAEPLGDVELDFFAVVRVRPYVTLEQAEPFVDLDSLEGRLVEEVVVYVDAVYHVDYVFAGGQLLGVDGSAHMHDAESIGHPVLLLVLGGVVVVDGMDHSQVEHEFVEVFARAIVFLHFDERLFGLSGHCRFCGGGSDGGGFFFFFFFFCLNTKII